MANGTNGDSKFSRWMANGLLSTVAWSAVLIIYCAFRAFGIQDPLLGQAFLLLTGAWVGNLTLAQGKKTAKTEDKVDKAEEKLEILAKAAIKQHPEILKEHPEIIDKP